MNKEIYVWDDEEREFELKFVETIRAALSVHLEMGNVLGLREEDIYSRLKEISTGVAGEDGFDLMDAIHTTWSPEAEPKLQIFMTSARASFRGIMAFSREHGLDDVDYVLNLVIKEFEESFEKNSPETWLTHPSLRNAALG